MPSAKELAKALAYRGEIRNTPQNRFLGGVANFLAPVSEFADRDKLPESIPLLGGMSAADLIGLKGTESLLRDMSYGKSPISGASLNTVKVDPRLLDVAGLGGAMIPVGKALSKAALRNVAEQVQNKTGIIGRNVIDPRMSVVPKGKAMPDRPAGLLGHPKLNVLPNERFALVEGNSNLRVEHKPDGTFTISHSPAWGETGKPFTLNGDSVDDLISTAESRLKRSEVAMTAAAKSKHSKTVGGMLELKHGDNFEYTKSARSDSQYITHTPTGAKIRISDHKLPDVYESPDFEVSGALSKKEQAQSISKFLDDYATERVKDDARMGIVPKSEAVIGQAMSVPVKAMNDGGQDVITYVGRKGQKFQITKQRDNELLDIHSSIADKARDIFGDGVEIFDSGMSSSRYVSLPNGSKIRVSDHPLPSDFAAIHGVPDIEVRGGQDLQKAIDYMTDVKSNNTISNSQKRYDDLSLRDELRANGVLLFSTDARQIRKLVSDGVGYDDIASQLQQKYPKLTDADAAKIYTVIGRGEFDKFVLGPQRAKDDASVGVGGMLDPQAIAEALRQQDRK